MSTFGSLMAGCIRAEALGEVPTGSSLFDLKERAAIAAQKAAHHAEAGHAALARSWSAAATRLRKELQSRLKHTSLGEVGELGIGMPTKVIAGGLAVAGLTYGLYKLGEKKYWAERAEMAERAEET